MNCIKSTVHVADMDKPEEHPPCTPAPYHSARGLELPEWSAGFKLSSPTFSRATPARTPWHLGPPQVVPYPQSSRQSNVWNFMHGRRDSP